MLKADIFELNNVEYIVIDTANITIEQMLDTAWEIFGKYFTAAETGIKQALVDKYWKKA